MPLLKRMEEGSSLGLRYVGTTRDYLPTEKLTGWVMTPFTCLILAPKLPSFLRPMKLLPNLSSFELAAVAGPRYGALDLKFGSARFNSDRTSSMGC